MTHPSQIRSIRQLVKAPAYLWGWDLSLSGWGHFAYPETPERLTGMDWQEFWDSPVRQRCPVIYACDDKTDETLLRFNCRQCDVRIECDYPYKIGQPSKKPTEAEIAHMKAELEPYKHSIVAVVVAGSMMAKFERSGMHQLLHWLFVTHHMPFVTVRSRETAERWYTEPALGWTFYDAQETPYKFAHPSDYPKRGDYALEKDDVVRLQRYTYTGRYRRYKVFPQEVSDAA